MTMKKRTEEEITKILKLSRQEIKKNWIKNSLAEKIAVNGQTTVRHCALGAIGHHTPEFKLPPERVGYDDIDFDTSIALAYAVDKEELLYALSSEFEVFQVKRAKGILKDTHREQRTPKEAARRAVSYEIEEIVYGFNDVESEDRVRDKFAEAIDLIPEALPVINRFHNRVDHIAEKIKANDVEKTGTAN